MAGYHKLRLQALTCFFVFNPKLAPKETDDETKKILYYFPSKNVPRGTQCAYVGLVSGLCNFCKDFASQPAHALHTERNRYVFDEVEPDMWMALVLKNPRKDLKTDRYGRRTVVTDDVNTAAHSGDEDNNSALPCITSEYFMEDELEDSVLHTIVKSAYSTFVFFHGTFDHLVNSKGGGDAGFDFLRSNLRRFFKYYLPTIQFHQLRYYADIYGFRFFAVDRTTYLTLQYLSNIVQSEFPLQYLCVMYGGKLIWSGLEQEDMKVLYTNNQEPNDSYMYTFMATKNGDEDGAATRANGKANGNMNGVSVGADGLKLNGEFLTGPKSKDYYSAHTPIVYLCKTNRFYRLVCYKLRKLKFFWLMHDDSIRQPCHDATLEICDQLDLEADIAKQLETEQNNDDDDDDDAHAIAVATKSETPDLGPLADDVTSKYFTQKLRINNLEDAEFDNKMSMSSSSTQMTLDFYERLQQFVEPHAAEIIKELERHEKRQNMKQSKPQPNQSSNFRFLYFNHFNLALKSILKAPGKKLSSDTCRTLRNIHADFENSAFAISEVCAKCSDGWVIARKSHFGGRELYLLVDHAEAAQLKDLQQHMDALQEEYFGNIFML